MEANKTISVLKSAALSIIALIFSVGLGLGIIHFSGFPYSADIHALNISEFSGLSEEEITLNYNAVMDYLRPFNKAEFDLPTLGFTETGAEHFKDCRDIFNLVYLLSGLAGLSLLFLAVFKRKKITSSQLKLSGILTLAFPIILGLGLAVNFDNLFLLFHSLIFEQGSWVFNPAKDEIIKILPGEFFMHCGMLLLGVCIFFGLLQFSLGYVKANRE
ncbi:MAG: TIGR01906 family membrane protein [Oscillospiraceae bacterium]